MCNVDPGRFNVIKHRTDFLDNDVRLLNFSLYQTVRTARKRSAKNELVSTKKVIKPLNTERVPSIVLSVEDEDSIRFFVDY